MKSDQGMLMNIELGILGALTLNWLLFSIIGSSLAGWFGRLIVAAAGVCLPIAAARMIRRNT